MKTTTIFKTSQYRLDKITMLVVSNGGNALQEIKWYQAYQRKQLGKTAGEWVHIGRLETEELARAFVSGCREN